MSGNNKISAPDPEQLQDIIEDYLNINSFCGETLDKVLRNVMNELTTECGMKEEDADQFKRIFEDAGIELSVSLVNIIAKGLLDGSLSKKINTEYGFDAPRSTPEDFKKLIAALMKMRPGE